MEANELRIGNYCEYYIEDKMEKSDPGFWVKNKIDLQDIECCLNNKEHFDKFYRAMPLTDELLEKCGFEFINSNNNYGWIKNCDNRQLCWCHSDFISIEFKPSQFDEFGDTIFDIKAIYLHQLQNLIFALTGTELEIKL